VRTCESSRSNLKRPIVAADLGRLGRGVRRQQKGNAMKLELIDGRYVFTGDSIPMELARKTWGDKYGAVRAAEAAGFVVMANGNVAPDEQPGRDTYAPSTSGV
jgi:hypothetical protein